MTLFKYAPALLPACRRFEDLALSAQIPADVKAHIVGLVAHAAMQTGALHAIEEVERWLRDNQLKIVKEDQCESLLPEPEAPSGDTS